LDCTSHLGRKISAVKRDTFLQFLPDRTLVSVDDTEDMPIPDHQYILTTQGAKLDEEGIRRLMQKLDALLV
jgi:hypothetical protein